MCALLSYDFTQRFRCNPMLLFFLFILVCIGLYGIIRTQFQGQSRPAAQVRHDDWPVLAVWNGGENAALPATVSDTWQITWHCGGTSPLHIEILNAQNSDIWLQTVSCLQNDTDGFAQITYTGAVQIEINLAGAWLIGIQESLQ